MTATPLRRDIARVELVDVDEDVLAEMVDAAVADAAPDEVTPQFEDGGTWSEERLAWLRELHRSRRDGLDGPLGEATWAVRQDGPAGPVVGQVRLKRTGDVGVVETGIWLTRTARGKGLGVAAIQAAVDRAVAYGATAVYAETRTSNVHAQAVLRKLGFALSRGRTDADVVALLRLVPR
jgi:RimJ/RimL family protein N-acetyltransferase